MVLNDVKDYVSKDEYKALLSIYGVRNIPLSTRCYLRNNGNYQMLFIDDGTKLRFGSGDSMEPDMPECIDVTISKWCRGNCPYCYLGCSTDGGSADLLFGSKVYQLMMQLPEYTEVAININDLLYYIHKLDGFDMFLKFMSDRNLFVNATINQNALYGQTIDELHGIHYRGLLRGIGVSMSHYDEELVNDLKDAIGMEDLVYQVIAGIIDPEDVRKLIEQGANVLILGYKSLGRGKPYAESNWDELVRRTYDLECLVRNTLTTIQKRTVSKGTISFDGLAIEQLQVKDWLDPVIYKAYYAGDEGAYTFYLDLVDMKYAQSSISGDLYDVGDMSIKEMFDSIRVPGLHN